MLMEELIPKVDEALRPIQEALNTFVTAIQELWAEHGDEIGTWRMRSEDDDAGTNSSE